MMKSIQQSLAEARFLIDEWQRLPGATVSALIRSTGAGYPLTFAATLLAAGSMMLYARHFAPLAMMMPAGAALLAISIGTLVDGFRNRARAWCFADPDRAQRLLFFQATLTAGAWSVLLVSVGMWAPEPFQMIVVCTMLGVGVAGALRYAAVPLSSAGFVFVSLIGMVSYIVVVDLPSLVFLMLIIFVALLFKSLTAQAKLFLSHQRAAAELLRNAVEQGHMMAASERVELARAQRDMAIRQEAEQARARELAAISQRFETSVLALSADLSERACTGRDSASALAEITAVAIHASSALRERVESGAHGTDDMRRCADDLSASLAALQAGVQEQTRAASMAQTSFDANEVAAAQLLDKAGRIREIVTVIGDIAGRTNLLALNASIEAARAGESGRGFTVVAQEVKSLAAQTRHATANVADQIDGMLAAIDDVASGLSAVRSAFGSVHALADTVDRTMADQRQLVDAVTSRSAAAADLQASLAQDATGAARVSDRAGALSDALARTATDIVARSAELLDATRDFAAEMRPTASAPARSRAA